LTKIPFIETVFHILNRNLPQGTGQRSGLLALLILIHLTIYSVAYLGEVLTDPLTKKQSLITTIMEVFDSSATSPGSTVP
jgi:hypothetical protein